MRKLAQFMLWLGLFGLFLAFAANSTGSSRPDILISSLILLFFAWRVLRRPVKRYEPTRRFRTLRRMGLIAGEPEGEEQR